MNIHRTARPRPLVTTFDAPRDRTQKAAERLQQGCLSRSIGAGQMPDGTADELEIGDANRRRARIADRQLERAKQRLLTRLHCSVTNTCINELVTRATPSRISPSAIARASSPRLYSSATYVVSVLVAPRMLPPTINAEPSSVNARENARNAPETTASLTSHSSQAICRAGATPWAASASPAEGASRRSAPSTTATTIGSASTN